MTEPLTITIPQPGPWVSMNDRPAHWAQRNAPAQVWRAAARVACRGLAPLTPPVEIDAVVHKSRAGRWDAHNLMATVKHAIDGLVDAGLLPDDSNTYLKRVSIEAGAKSAEPCLHLTITEITIEGDAMDSYHLPCPTCGARAFQQCRSLTKGRKTDTHAARLALYRRPTEITTEGES